MLKFFKNLFGSGQSQGQAEDNGYESQYVPAQQQHANVAQAHAGNFRQPAAYGAQAAHQPSYGGSQGMVRVPLYAIIAVLPLELKTRLQQSSVTGISIDLPLEHVLAQLAGGSVRISFGELRAMAPDVFSLQADRDHIQIALPLNEILPQINPAFLPRRQSQRQIDVPDDVRGPFGEDCFGVTFAETRTITGTPVTGSSEPMPEPAAAPAPPPPPVVPRAVQPPRPPTPFAPVPRAVQPPKPPTPPTQRPAPAIPPNLPPAVFSRAVPPAKPAPSAPPAPTSLPKVVQPSMPAAPVPGPRAIPPSAPTPPIPLQRMVPPGKPAPPPAVPRAVQPPTPPPVARAPAKVNPPTPPASPIPFRGHFTSTPAPSAPAATPSANPPVRPAFPQARGVGATPSPGPVPGLPAAGSNGNGHGHAPDQDALQFTQFTKTPQSHPTIQSQPAPHPTQLPQTAPEACLDVQLAAVCETWPEVLQDEIVQTQLSKVNLALPVKVIEPALRQGKIAFPWKVLRSWIRPAVQPAVSEHDDMVLELPLSIIAPLFINRQKQGAGARERVDLDENIPNLFFGFPQPDSPQPAAEAPVAAPSAMAQQSPAGEGTSAIFSPAQKPAGVPDTNFYVWGDSADTPQVDETEFKRKPSIGTEFLSRYATPNEVVSRAAALDGIVGALVALPDGLMVASKLSADLNGDTLAAFLPHIFGKVSQCTKELRMGELNNLHFTVGNVPWKIFRVNAIFFAAFGRAGQPLPTAQLAALAAELDRKKTVR